MLENSKIAKKKPQKKIQNGKALRKKKRDDQLLIFKTLSSELKFKRKKNQNKKKSKQKPIALTFGLKVWPQRVKVSEKKSRKTFFFSMPMMDWINVMNGSNDSTKQK